MAENKPIFVLDSFAILAYYHAESSGERVIDLSMRESALEEIYVKLMTNR